MKILDYNNTTINLSYLLYLKLEIDKENPKKSYITITLNDTTTTNNILIKYEDLISDERLESMKPKVLNIKVFEPERLLELIYWWITFFMSDETEERKTYMNMTERLDDLIHESSKKNKECE